MTISQIAKAMKAMQKVFRMLMYSALSFHIGEAMPSVLPQSFSEEEYYTEGNYFELTIH